MEKPIEVWVVFNQHGEPAEIGLSKDVATGKTIGPKFPEFAMREKSGWTVRPVTLIEEKKDA